MQKWEYKVITQQQLKTINAWAWTDSESDIRFPIERLNELGKEGWELIDIRNVTRDNTKAMDYYFKRPIES